MYTPSWYPSHQLPSLLSPRRLDSALTTKCVSVTCPSLADTTQAHCFKMPAEREASSQAAYESVMFVDKNYLGWYSWPSEVCVHLLRDSHCPACSLSSTCHSRTSPRTLTPALHPTCLSSFSKKTPSILCWTLPPRNVTMAVADNSQAPVLKSSKDCSATSGYLCSS